ncbi:hypothetical protein J6T66_05990 [bacterium]|nr:hypothetical protein [bacterium]
MLSEKVNEREKFKQDMLLYGAGAVTVSPTVDKESVYLKYEDFASYFENLYK